ncbi:MAG: electron transport complex subunit E [Eubacteriaceae bacterium]|nr:electron transport complex subunit E [Eubacteriaceae bacterium]MBQ1466356.1 electron transport complex subunit E [Eubacteriaceae bacterium]MCR4893986.1 electron transport complex subunit E [Eubacteriales bacterium]
MKPLKVLTDGILKNNPTFRLMLGMCATLAVTTSAINGFGMGVSTMVVLIFSNIFISLLRKVIPNEIRIPCFIVVIATFTTIVDLVLHAYVPTLHAALGLYIPLIVVNCIILGRAESFASKNDVLLSTMDGIGCGIGFTLALTLIGLVREFFGAGTLFGLSVLGASYEPMLIMIMPPGAFIVLGTLMGIVNKVVEGRESK